MPPQFIILIAKPVTNPQTAAAYKAPPYSVAPYTAGPNPVPPLGGIPGEPNTANSGLPYLR